MKLLERKGTRKHVEGLRDLVSVHRILNQIVAVCPVARAVVVRSCNNGGIPKPGCVVNVKVLYQNFNKPGDSLRGIWDEREADEQQCEVLLDIAQNEEIVINTKDLIEGSELRNVYEAGETVTVRSYIFRLCLTSREMIYLAINYSELRDPTPQERVVMDQAVSSLKAIFTFYHE